ncbi:DUF1697 domain-containing protein [Bacillus sp. JJ1764]|uniref:DUF1697 domain-containing protein n=1 Tax=Bacillus sp. JJ1764 TaxID=3122964 RepID=UPI002FFE2162
MTIYIGLLRGINVGGHHIIKMADLRNLLEAMGLRKVKTYIQSGNILFESDEESRSLTRRLEDEISKTFGFPVPVVLRTATELNEIIQNCPYTLSSLDEGESVHVAFLAEEPSPEGVNQLSSFQNEKERFQIIGKQVYLFFQISFRDSKLAAKLSKLGVHATVRNWKTVMKLDSLVNTLK